VVCQWDACGRRGFISGGSRWDECDGGGTQEGRGCSDAQVPIPHCSAYMFFIFVWRQCVLSVLGIFLFPPE
jgi:hypothetical protein